MAMRLEDLFTHHADSGASVVTSPLSWWLHRESVDACTWMPQRTTVAHDTSRQIALPDAPYELVPAHQAERIAQILANQLALSQRIVGAQGEELWAAPSALAQAKAVPVQLGFRITASAHALLPFFLKSDDTTILPIANPFPPSAWGECALIDTGQGYWHLYTLATTGDAGFALWEQIGVLIKTLAGTLEWPIYTELLACCADTSAYEHLRAPVQERMRQAKGETRRQAQDELKALRAAHKHSVALQEWAGSCNAKMTGSRKPGSVCTR